MKINPQAIPVEIGVTINREPVIDNFEEFEVVAIRTEVSTVVFIEDNTPEFFFLQTTFIFEAGNHFL